MCCPWLFFDGKLFHFKLLKANNNTPLIDMCDGQVGFLYSHREAMVEQVLRVERLRQAVLENIRVEFAKPLLPSASTHLTLPMGPAPDTCTALGPCTGAAVAPWTPFHNLVPSPLAGDEGF
nr:hypothetical protein BaRGS_024235 [Batillaria attramentaria]